MNNTTDNTANYLLTESDDSPNYYTLTFYVLMSVTVITLVTNTLTVFVVVTTPKLHTHTNAFIVSLAVCEIIFSLYTIILNLIVCNKIDSLLYSEAFLMAYIFTWHVRFFSSYGNLFLVSLERWVYIAKPFLYQRCVTTRTVIGSITTTWVISFVVSIPYLCIDQDSILFYEEITHAYIRTTIHTALFFVLVAMYTHICLISLKQLKKLSKARVHSSQQTWQNDDSQKKAKKRLAIHVKNVKSIKLLISICGIFFLFMSPHIYLNAFAYTNTFDRNITLDMLFFCNVLMTLFHCSNFFVYTLRVPLFRKTLEKQFCKL